MKNNNMVRIDGEKLRKAIESRGLIMSDASEELGFNRMFISNCRNRGQMSRYAMVALQSRFGIPTEEYMVKDKPEIIKVIAEEPVQQPEVKTEPIDYERLWKVIYTASFEAFKKALEGGKE